MLFTYSAQYCVSYNIYTSRSRTMLPRQCYFLAYRLCIIELDARPRLSTFPFQRDLFGGCICENQVYCSQVSTQFTDFLLWCSQRLLICFDCLAQGRFSQWISVNQELIMEIVKIDLVSSVWVVQSQFYRSWEKYGREKNAFLSCRGIFCCNISSVHVAKLEAKPHAVVISRSEYIYGL